MLTDLQIQTLEHTTVILRGYHGDRPHGFEYIDGWRAGRVETTADTVLQGIHTILRHEAHLRRVDPPAEPDSAELEAHSDPHGRCQ